MVGVGDDGGDDGGAFSIDHLLEFLADLAPAAGLEECGGGAGAVADVGHGDLDGVLVHGDFLAEDFGADDGVLGEVLGCAATDHEEATLGTVHLDLGELEEVGHAVDADVGLAGLFAEPLVLADAEACGAVAKGGAEDGDAALVAGLDEAVFLHAVTLGEPFANVVEELAAAVGTGLEEVGDVAGSLVASLEFFLVDEGVVDAVDVELAELGVGNDVFLGADVVLVAEGLEEVHVDDGGAGGDDSVDHLVAHHVDVHLHAAGSAGGAGDGEDVGAVLLGQHLAEDVGGAGGVAAGEAHVAHGVDELGAVILLDVNVLDGFFQEVFLFHCYYCFYLFILKLITLNS